MLLSAVGSNIDQGQDINDYLSISYVKLALGVLRSVEDDLDTNQGGKFRTIIQSLNGEEVLLVLSNEDIRDWLIERQNEHPNKELTMYDFETAVVAAVILRVIDTLYDAQQATPSPN